MNGVRKILSGFIALTFLMSATGVFYVKHTCLHSGNTTYQLSEKSDCCIQETEINSCCESQSDKSSCTVQNEATDCCVFEPVYLKGNSEYQISETTYSIDQSDYQLFEVTLTNFIASSEHTQFNSIPQPPYKSPRDVLIKNNILII